MPTRRQGDPEPLRDFIRRAHSDEVCELAGLNYWAYWVGESGHPEHNDLFMVDRSRRWRGMRLLKHIVDRLDDDHGFVDLYVHTLWALLSARPGVLREDVAMSRDLYCRGEQLLATDAVSAQSRQELVSILYGMRVEGHGG